MAHPDESPDGGLKLSTLLLATDGSRDAELASRTAADLARRSGAALHLVHVWKPVQFATYSYALPPDPYNMYEQEARDLLQRESGRVEGYGAGAARGHFSTGSPPHEIVQLAQAISADLIVMGSRGRNALQRLVVGSVSEGVVYHAHCPVLLMRGAEHSWPPRSIVIGEDFSAGAERAADIGCRLASVYGATPTLLSAYPEPPRKGDEASGALDDALELVRRHMEERASELEAAVGVRPQTALEQGEPATALVRAADAADQPVLLVVGSHGKGALERLRLGSVSTKVVRAAVGPVLVYPVRERQT
ncbi:MAG: universal stress protein [Chloroflexota bacterium]|nr:universal stress protein [Chloroflexota bacterium]